MPHIDNEIRKNLAQKYDSVDDLLEHIDRTFGLLDDLENEFPTDEEIVFLTNTEMEIIDRMRESIGEVKKLLFAKKTDFKLELR